MKAYLILGFLAACTATTFYVVWMNRASERIITAVIPIAVAALLGVGMTVFVFGGEPAVTMKFPAVFLYRVNDKTPYVPSSRPLLNSLFEVPELIKDRPDLIPDATNGGTLYHHLLQRAIVDSIAMRYRHSWEIEINRFELAGSTQTTYGPNEGSAGDSTKLSFQQVKSMLKGNRFSDSPYMNPEITLPPGSQMIIKPPAKDDKLGEVGEISIRNDFVQVNITTARSIWSRGLGGYRQFVNCTEAENDQIASSQYLISIRAEFSTLRSGHPEMAKYKKWVSQIVSELQTEFDEQMIWKQAKERFLLTKQLEQFSGQKFPERPPNLAPPEYH